MSMLKLATGVAAAALALAYGLNLNSAQQTCQATTAGDTTLALAMDLGRFNYWSPFDQTIQASQFAFAASRNAQRMQFFDERGSAGEVTVSRLANRAEFELRQSQSPVASAQLVQRDARTLCLAVAGEFDADQDWLQRWRVKLLPGLAVNRSTRSLAALIELAESTS